MAVYCNQVGYLPHARMTHVILVWIRPPETMCMRRILVRSRRMLFPQRDHYLLEYPAVFVTAYFNQNRLEGRNDEETW